MIRIPNLPATGAGAMRFVLLAFVVVMGLTATACRAPEEPLRVGILAWPPYDMVYLAQSEGVVSTDLYDVVPFQTPSELVRSFRYGLIDVMFVTSHFAVSTLNEVGDTRVIYVIDVSVGGDALLARPPIDSAEALKGRRVGVEVAPLGMYTLVRALDELGLARDEIEVVNIDTADQFEAWRQGEVDAVVTYEPTRGKLRALGAVELFNSKAIPYEIVDVMVVGQSTIETRGRSLVELVRAFDEALALYRRSPEETVPEMANRHAISEQAYRRAMAGVEMKDLSDNQKLLSGDDNRLMEALERQCEVMQEAGMLVTLPDLDPLIDASIVEQAARR